MAMKAKKDENGKVAKTIGEKYSRILETEALYGKQALLCDEKGLIKLTKAQRVSCNGYVGIASAKPTQELLHSSDNTHGKTLFAIGSNLNHAPMKQQSKSSTEVNKTVLQFEVAKMLLKEMTGSDDIYPYFLTFTYPNSDKGDFAENGDRASKRIGAILDQLKKGVSRGNGLKLVGGDYLGALVNREVTVNKVKFKERSTEGVWNDHVHVVLLSDKPLNVSQTMNVLFQRWQELNPEYKLSKNAFKMVKAYDPQNPQNSSKEAVVKAMKEVVKYSTKPDDLNFICEFDDDYSLEMFAELFNGLKGKQMRRRHGLLWYAANFLSKFDEFENAIRLTTVSEFPDVVTQLSKLVYNHTYKQYGRYEPVYVRELTSDEIIYHNRSLVEKILVSNHVADHIYNFINAFKTNITDELKRAYAEVFKSFVFANTLDDLLDKLDEFIARANRDKQHGKAYDIGLLSQAIKDKYKNGVLEIDLGLYNKQLADKRAQFYELYDKHVRVIKGVDATEEDKRDWALFAEKQGLSSMSVKKDVTIDLFAVSSYSDDELDDYLGASLLGRSEWEKLRDERDEKEHEIMLAEKASEIQILKKYIGRHTRVYPNVLAVPYVKLSRPKIIVEVILDTFQVARYDATGYELAVVGESMSHICDSYKKERIEIINPFL